MTKNFRFLISPFVLLFGFSYLSSAQVVTTLATGLPSPIGIAVGSLDTVYVGSESDYRIRKIDPLGGVSIFIGTGTSGSLDGTGTLASIRSVYDMEFDHLSGNLFFTQYSGGQVRKVTPSGVVSTIATVTGSGIGIAIGKNDTIYTYSYSTGALNKIDPLGLVTFISTLPTLGLDLEFLSPDTLYLGGLSTHQIYQVNHLGAYTILAGSGSPAYADGSGTAASFFNPTGLTIDGSGNIFVVDLNTSRVRLVTPAGVVTTFAGRDTSASLDGTGTLAGFYFPWGIDMSKTTGNFFVSEQGGTGAVRMITGGVPVALPLHWLSYAASLSNRSKAQISWSVNETEVNNYQILKSTDAKNFLPIAMVNSKGNGEHNYSFTETQSLNGTAYYRIQQSDLDGQSTTTATMSLHNTGIDNTMKVYPTIFSDGFTIETSAVQHAKLSNNSGQTIQTIELKIGKNYIATDILPSGIYYLQTDFTAQKLIKN